MGMTRFASLLVLPLGSEYRDNTDKSHGVPFSDPTCVSSSGKHLRIFESFTVETRVPRFGPDCTE